MQKKDAQTVVLLNITTTFVVYYYNTLKCFTNKFAAMEKEKSISRNGVSVCAAGQENYTTFTAMGNRMKGTVFFQYDYRHTNGELFTCVKPSLEKCRGERDEWLRSKNF
jgi:hypothetical protein